MKRFLPALLALVVAVVAFAGCTSPSSFDSAQSEQQEQLLAEGTRQVGMPNITNFFERKALKNILEMRDNPDLVTYAYTQALSGKFVYLGRAIGYGIPFSTQFTNPQKIEDWLSQGGYAILPQADPNGLFSSGSTSATWVILINEQTNEPEVLYLEPTLAVFQSKLPRRLVEEWSLPDDY